MWLWPLWDLPQNEGETETRPAEWNCLHSPVVNLEPKDSKSLGLSHSHPCYRLLLKSSCYLLLLISCCLVYKLNSKKKKKSLKSQYHDPEYVCGALAETLALMLLGTSMFSVLSQFCLLYWGFSKTRNLCPLFSPRRKCRRPNNRQQCSKTPTVNSPPKHPNMLCYKRWSKGRLETLSPSPWREPGTLPKLRK